MTNGRRECIERTIPSAESNLAFQFNPRYIIDDSADPRYTAWLQEMFGNRYVIFPTEENLGFCGSIQRAWNLLVTHEQAHWPSDGLDYIFHLEDDFLFNEYIGLASMVSILEMNPHLAQVSLLRQPCNEPERKAGGVIQLYPQDFHQKEQEGRIWTEHGRFFTTNPSLYPRHIIDKSYPQEEFCEGKFTIKLLEGGFRFAYLGKKDQKPKVEHIGGRTAGSWKWV